MTVQESVLEAIVAATRRALEVRRVAVPAARVEEAAEGREPQGDRFRRRLERRDGHNVIAECKRRSPSRGILRHAYHPGEIAEEYEAAGAAAISVLTEPCFFDGSLEHLRVARSAVEIPLLCKDFIVDGYQLLEARAAGADAVLLIVAAVEQPVLLRLHEEAGALGLATLVEAHDREELERALELEGAVIGVNQRDLRTLRVDAGLAAQLVDCIPEDRLAVAESGLSTSGAVRSLREAGYDGFLVGEHFMTHASPGACLAALLDEGSAPAGAGPT